MNGLSHFAPLESSETSVDAGSNEGEPRSNRKSYLYPVLLIVAGVLLSLYAFWNLQFGSKDWRLLLLVGCFLLIAYGTNLFLEVSESRSNSLIQRPQLLEDTLRHQNELSGTAIHDRLQGRLSTHGQSAEAPCKVGVRTM